MGMLLAVGSFAGLLGVAAITCDGGSISYMMPPEKRGRAIWPIGLILGPVVGPGNFPCGTDHSSGEYALVHSDGT